jgi:hypothetical protein
MNSGGGSRRAFWPVSSFEKLACLFVGFLSFSASALRVAIGSGAQKAFARK